MTFATLILGATLNPGGAFCMADCWIGCWLSREPGDAWGRLWAGR